ncbi:MAG TPA: hypothetical protein VEB64_11250 [Azospirillaceae bacterium]|nr:hypothetical protein [Azospirillaceae bacterium]
MALKKIRLELARNREFPQGSAEHGYEFTAPLTTDGHFDTEEWRTSRQECRVRRFWSGQDDETGRLIHKGERWAFHYDGMDTEEDEPIFRFDRHTFREGEYVSITEHDGEQRTFKVVSVK